MKKKLTQDTYSSKVYNFLLNMRTAGWVVGVTRLIASNYFLYAVIALFVLQGVWFATSFYYPMLFDESFHFGLTSAFTDRWLPYLTNESTNLHHYRDLSTRGGLLFHYILSFPLRIFQAFDISAMWQVIGLRYINVALATAGLIVFVKVLRQIKIPQYAINIGLLLYALLPITTYVAGTINYDNALFLLSALFMLACCKAVVTDKDKILRAALLVVIYGCIASLIKFTFLPMFAAGVIAVAVIWLKRYGPMQISESIKTAFTRALDGWKTGILLLAAVVSVGLFSSVYIKNIVLHGSPNPACTKTLPLEQCLKSGLELRNYEAEQTKESRPTMPLSDYVMFDWMKTMTAGMSFVVVNTEQGVAIANPTPIAYSIITFGLFLSIVAMCIGWRHIPVGHQATVVYVIAVTTVLSLLLYNIQSYYHYHQIFANQSRYLIYVMPILLSLGVFITSRLLRGASLTKLVILTVSLLLLTQGGGALAYAVRSQPAWFFEDDTVRSVNDSIQSTVDPLIKG